MSTRNQTEAIEQAKAVRWAQTQLARYPALAFLFHTPNGGARNPVVAGQMKALGVKRGVPDLLLPVYMVERGPLPRSAAGLVIEMKAPGGRLSPDQWRWLDWLAAQGWITTVAKSAEDAQSALRAYMDGDFAEIPRHVPVTC